MGYRAIGFRVQVHNNWVLAFSAIVVSVQIVGRYMTIRHGPLVLRDWCPGTSFLLPLSFFEGE